MYGYNRVGTLVIRKLQVFKGPTLQKVFEGLDVEGRLVHTNTNTDHNQREPALGMDGGYGRMVFLCWRWHRNCKVLG